MLGSQWSKEELERFYGAYRKYGKDWRKVCLELIQTKLRQGKDTYVICTDFHFTFQIAGATHDRTSDMVEALYNMNKVRIGPLTLYNHLYFHLIT